MDNTDTGENTPIMENGNIGAWFNKYNHRDMQLIFDPQEQPSEGFVQAQPLHETAYQRYDEESGRWVANSHADALERIDVCKAELAAIDRAAGAGRAVRGLALAAAEMAGITGEDYARLREYEEQAAALRENIEQLMADMETEELPA